MSGQYPETATFLTEDERRYLIQTLAEDSKAEAAHFSTKFVWQALTDWKTYVQALNFLWYADPVTIHFPPLISLSTAS